MTFGWLLLALPLAALVCLALIATWRRPALGLGVFALGLAFHNAAIMVLLEAGTPGLVVRALQAWKELILIELVIQVVAAAWGSRSEGTLRIRAWVSATPRPVLLLDITAIAFTLLLLMYLLASSASVFGTQTSMTQMVLSFRTYVLIPLLYALGRIFGARDAQGLRISIFLVVAAAVSVAVIGLVELWFVSTRLWVDFGVIRFAAWQGFVYHGPGGLPENFFQSTNQGYGLRRMVSTYISPLGIAYTALLVIPLIVGLVVASKRRPRGWTWAALALVLISISLSVTRLALLCLVLEAVLWVVVTQRRTSVIAGVLAVAALWVGFSVYPLVAPLVTFDLVDVRPPAGAALIGTISADVGVGHVTTPPPSTPVDPDLIGRIVNQEDASIQSHILAVKDGLDFVVHHPLGTGLGSTTPRFGTPTGPGESAFLGIAGEVGLLGGALFALLYGGVALVGLIGVRRLKEPATVGLALLVGVGAIGLAPIVMTSAVWGDFSVTFLFWWAAGAIVSVVAATLGADKRPADSPIAGQP
jgi:hypothetical protein